MFHKQRNRRSTSFLSRIDGMVCQSKQPVLQVTEHLQQAKKTLICYLARSIKMLNGEIAERDKQINDYLDSLSESDWIRSLPGAGKVLAPALLSCLGRDPQRFASVAEARALMGTAPATIRHCPCRPRSRVNGRCRSSSDFPKVVPWLLR
jgi:hypothetical protein